MEEITIRENIRQNYAWGNNAKYTSERLVYERFVINFYVSVVGLALENKKVFDIGIV